MKKNYIYHFFSCGELIESVEAKTEDEAAKIFLELGYNIKDCDYLVRYNRKNGKYAKLRLCVITI